MTTIIKQTNTNKKNKKKIHLGKQTNIFNKSKRSTWAGLMKA